MLACVLALGASLAPPGLSAVTAPTATAADRAQPALQRAAAGARRPNVILFLTDDQRLEDMVALPYVRRRIGGQGTVFSRAFSSYPLCCPARATLLTGQYAHNTGVMGNTPPYGGVTRFREGQTLATWLQGAGYNTIALSKYLNGYDRGTRRVPPGWTDWQVPVRDIYDYRSFTMNENGRLVDYRAYQTDHWQKRGVRLVRTYAERRRPFFLWTGFLAPHDGTPVERDDPRFGPGGGLSTPAVADRFRNTFADRDLPPKPSFLEEDMSDKPQVRPRTNRPRGEFVETYQQRLESLRSVDVAIRAMMRELERSGEADNTIVLFTSDNGHMIGEHRKYSKILGYEESARVPLMVTGPGFSRGVNRAQLVSLADIAPTVLAAAGVRARIRQDGRPLQPLSADPSAAASRAIPFEAGPAPGTGGRRLYTAIRTPEDQTLIRWWNGSSELYDLTEDPFQLDGGISAGETRAERRELMARLLELRDCAGASCR